MKFLFSVFFFIVFVSFLAATIINVPGDQPTIQEGIDIAVDGDTVLVQPDTYVENINYIGKNITVASLFLTTQDTTFISQTIIDGNQDDSVVVFENGEDSTTVLCGFTIQNGFGAGSYSWWRGDGITIGSYTTSAFPTIQNCVFKNNSCNYYGGGITLWCNSYPIFNNCMITDNTDIGIYMNNSNAIFINTIIVNNLSGLRCNSSNLLIINTNIISNNGYGIKCLDDSNPIVLNSILWNNSPEEIYFSSYDAPNSITMSYSDIQGGEDEIVTNNNGTVNWLEGNIDENPLFLGAGEHPYTLSEDSPCIDAGIPDTTGLNLPPWDVIGNLRIWDGDGNGSAIIDMGAYEYGAPPYVDIDDNVIVQTPEVFLHQNFPNPFNPETTINYQLTQNNEVELIIYNIRGQKVKTLVHEVLPAGEYSAIWDGKDSNGNRVGSGIYFYKLKAGDFQKVKKMILLK